MAWFDRLKNLLCGGRLNAEIDEELEYHLQSLVRDNLERGMPPERARQDAARRFGSRRQARDETRDANIFVWMDSMVRDVRYAARNFRKNLGATAVAVVSLA